MCNETKSNTNIGDVALPESKKGVVPPEYVGRIETPFGTQYIRRGGALDHAYMRSEQLASLLLLINDEGLEIFRSLNVKSQESLVWLARQLAMETQAMFDIVVADTVAQR